MTKFPLGLPEGSVRSLLALGIVLIFGLSVWFDVSEQAFTATVALTGSVVTSYFHKRSNGE